MNFGKLEFNEELKKRLSSAVDNDSLSHAVLLTGGTTKERKTLALHLSQAILCESTGEKPCLKCNTCKRIKAGVHPDVTLIEKEEGKSVQGLMDDIRRLKYQAFIAPNEAPFQIFIFLEAQVMQETHQNALLKLLEEPPQTTRYIFASRSRDDMLQTILSRVTTFTINENSGVAAGEKESAKAVAAAVKITEAVLTGNEYDIVLATGTLEKDRKNFKAAMEKMIMILRDAAVYKYNKTASADELTIKTANTVSTDKIFRIQKLLTVLIADCEKNANENMLLTRLSIGLKECIS